MSAVHTNSALPLQCRRGSFLEHNEAEAEAGGRRDKEKDKEPALELCQLEYGIESHGLPSKTAFLLSTAGRDPLHCRHLFSAKFRWMFWFISWITFLLSCMQLKCLLGHSILKGS
jgi:hypothetical protein